MDERQQEQTMAVELIRLRATEKQAKIRQIWACSFEQLEGFFMKYPIYSEIGVSMGELIKSPNIRLVQNQHRIYFGETQQHRKHGFGISLYSDGRVYEGSFVNNDRFGFGYEIYPNGNVFIGSYENNKKHGQGVFYWFNMQGSSTQYYRGGWWSGLPSGKGVHERANGDVYHGEFKNGLKHGEGLEKFCNGDSYAGLYVNGLPDGYGEYFWADGSHYKGDFKQGLRNGFGVWKKSNKPHCESYRGHYLLDKKSGYGLYVWNEGDYYKGHFYEDMKHGMGELYSNGASIYHGMWENGTKAPHLNHVYRQDKLKEKHPVRPYSTNQIHSIRQLSEGWIRPVEETNKKSASTTKKLQLQSTTNSKSQRRLNPSKNKTHYHEQQSKSTSGTGKSRCGHKNCIPNYSWLKTVKRK